MALNHTPAPWMSVEPGYSHLGASIMTPGFKKIAGSVHNRADATLIKSAPEMLDALILAHVALEYISEYDIPLCTKEAVVKAIESATGKKIEEVIDND